MAADPHLAPSRYRPPCRSIQTTPLPAPLAIGETSDSAGGGKTAASATATLVWPVANGGSISQYFSAGHLALDLPAAAGTQVSAAAGGIVTSAGWRNKAPTVRRP